MLFLNGEWRQGAGAELASFNPANEQRLWAGFGANAVDVADAVASARRALPAWRRTSIEQRSEILLAFRQQLEQHQVRLARLISEETGKPLWDAASEVQAMIGKIPVSLQALQTRRAPSEITVPGGTGSTRYKPLGVVAVFGPFNFPGHIANGQIVPALAAGNTVVFKPSELTPLVAQETVKLWEAAGLPAGVLNLVQGGRETGSELSSHPDVNGILFTGSLRTGVALQQALVGRPEVLLALELGGNNPLVVHSVQDVDAAVYWTIQSAYVTAGQRCTCARRLIVTDGNEAFVDRLISATRQIRVGAPDADPQPFFGPLINAAAAQHVLAAQKELIQSGAKLLVPARPLDLGSAYVSPGLLDVTDCELLRDEEVFGPLLQVIRVPDLNAAIDRANRTQYGLVAALFSDHREDFETFYDAVNAGLVNWNRPTTGASGQLPFGGIGRSGNHRPAGYFMIDACNSPVGTMEAPRLVLPETFSPGIVLS
ncbi:succinylglutamate-semialdehyde dehydrogenase [Planctomicrobium piriforme]|uniref:Succinylglutamic semialdehyde dehydrogenase n=1 Tax=Planctomicrobium piriforme TaxID=1576369 RepID=A0A1I3T4J8_9PLAN|nr:succinylglutamate-semialdehyde dehydrogenase [Planctomicrobium piriforme]SFJ64606.1 succinylglutamic semialdehyde dehydrogenase [Planctomicrobium piriforme]